MNLDGAFKPQCARRLVFQDDIFDLRRDALRLAKKMPFNLVVQVLDRKIEKRPIPQLMKDAMRDHVCDALDSGVAEFEFH